MPVVGVTARIRVVEQVWIEITQHAPQALADPRLEREAVIEMDPALQAKFSLQSGETAAIAFALRHPASLLLTDDAAARRARASVGLAGVGTIGLILEAARSKRVPVDEALQALEQLPNNEPLDGPTAWANQALRAPRRLSEARRVGTPSKVL